MGCTYAHTGPSWARVPIPGDEISMYLPEYLIEVTPSEGKSQFVNNSPDTSALKEHLKLAHKWQNRHKPFNGLAAGGQQLNGRGQFWHARMLPVPYGGLLNFSNIAATPGPTDFIPTCFTGLSEFLSDQWMKGIADKPFALAWSPLLLACRHPAGRAINEGLLQRNAIAGGQSSMGSLPDVDTNIGGVGGSCSYPVSAKQAIALNLAGNTDALNPGVQCLGPLGGLLPRQGLIPHQNRPLGAHTAAWKFASLVKTMHPGSPGITSNDKWQMMYPRSARSSCYRPSSSIDMALPKFEFRSPMMAGRKAESYIFAIWRKRTRCIKAHTGAVWKVQMIGEIQTKKSSICPML